MRPVIPQDVYRVMVNCMLKTAIREVASVASIALGCSSCSYKSLYSLSYCILSWTKFREDLSSLFGVLEIPVDKKALYHSLVEETSLPT